VEADAIAPAGAVRHDPKQILVLGWNDGAETVIREFDHFLVPGSSLLLLAEEPGAEQFLDQAKSAVANTSLEHRQGSPADRETLEAIELERFDHVVVLSDQGLDAQRADARTLVTLLHLRDLADHRGATCTVVSEMIDERNRRLAEVTRVDDVIVSDKIISLMLTQISETPELSQVFGELLSAGGSELYLRPAGDYVRAGREVDYATVVEAAARRGECAIGFRVAAGAEDPAGQFGVRVNPPKSERVALADGDRVIVLAEN
jgi:hypothetical protein